MRLLLVDDHQVVIEGLTALLTARGHTVAYTATDVDSALKFRDMDWDLAVLDLYIQEENGLVLVRELRTSGIAKPILIFSMGLESAWHTRVFNAGAQGFIHKGGDLAQLVQAIDNISEGRRYLSPYQQELIIDRYVIAPKSTKKVELSKREEEVLAYIAEGLTPKQIRERLQLSANTVGTFRARIMKKLDITTPAELLRYALIRFSKNLPPLQ